MSEWLTVTVKVSSYLKGRIGWQGLRAIEFMDEGAFLITGTDFKNGKIDWSTCYHVTEERYREAAYIHVKNSDLLITKDGTIGKVAFVEECPEKAVLNSGIFLLRSKDGLYDHRFVYYVLTSLIFEKFLRLNLNGSTINHLYQNVFEKFPIPIPHAKTQRKIAAILTTVDTAIEKTEALLEKYQQIKAGLMHDLFTRGVLPNGKLRPPREQAPELYQETAVGWIPKEWGQPVTLESLLANVLYNFRCGPFGSALLKSELVENGVPFLGIDNIHIEKFQGNFKRFVSEKKFQELFQYSVRPRDVVITIMGTVGRSCVIPEHIDQAMSSKHLWTMTFDTDKVIPELVCWQLNYAVWTKSWFRRGAQGGVMDAIQSKTLKQLKLPCPSINEQQLIFERYKALNKILETERLNLEKLQMQKLGLMQDLLTGKVEVSVG